MPMVPVHDAFAGTRSLYSRASRTRQSGHSLRPAPSPLLAGPMRGSDPEYQTIGNLLRPAVARATVAACGELELARLLGRREPGPAIRPAEPGSRHAPFHGGGGK
jgi:hypothetical protein